jgi:hypothetical protein
MLIHVSHLENLSFDISIGEIIWCPEFYAQPYIPSVPGVFFFFWRKKVAGI